MTAVDPGKTFGDQAAVSESGYPGGRLWDRCVSVLLVRILDAQVARRVDDGEAGGVLADDLETVVVGHIEGTGHGIMHALRDRGAVGGRLAGGVVNADEGHGRGLLLLGLADKATVALPQLYSGSA